MIMTGHPGTLSNAGLVSLGRLSNKTRAYDLRQMAEDSRGLGSSSSVVNILFLSFLNRDWNVKVPIHRGALGLQG